MQQGREEELQEEEEEDGGPERALEKSPFELTAGDVYDISSVVGRDLLQLSTGPRVPAALARLQFRIVRVLEMLEALVSESSLAEEQLRMERDSLRRELEELRRGADRGSAPQVGAHRATHTMLHSVDGRLSPGVAALRWHNTVVVCPLSHMQVLKPILTPDGSGNTAAVTGRLFTTAEQVS